MPGQIARLGRAIKREREQRDWSQRKLADLAGLNHAAISRIESGQGKDLRSESLAGIAAAFGMTPDQLQASAAEHLPEGEARSFGARLRAARERRGFAVEQLAARVRVSPEYITDLEADRVHEFTPEVLRDLAKALGVDIWEMLIAAGIIDAPPQFRRYANWVYDVKAEDEDLLTAIEVLLKRLKERGKE